MNSLRTEVENTFRDILRTHIFDSHASLVEQQRQLQRRRELRSALKTCTFGDWQAKLYIKEYIVDILISKLHFREGDLEHFIAFESGNLSVRDKFDILLYQYIQKHENRAIITMIEDNQLEEPKVNEDGEVYYEISEEQIHAIYRRNHVSLDYYDKLQILSQRLYSWYRGNGVIDEIRDMTIDGVSAGVSGITNGMEVERFGEVRVLPASYESIWLFYKGKSIHLSFLGFESEKELIRVCKNIYRYNNPGQLSEVRGYIVNEMMDGSRVAVARPPFCEGWVLFIRKFHQELQRDIHSLITGNNCMIPIQLMKWLIRGCQVIAITGEQGSGKTTLLMSLIRFIRPTYNLRVQELSFELHLRKIYPRRNIVSFKETDYVSGIEGLDFAKKTDGSVNILGEVATASVASWMISMSQVASLFTLFTHHAKTTKDLVYSMRNALLTEGGFHNEVAATKQVVDAIQFDVHMCKHADGHRYVERISQIIPVRQSVIQTCYRPSKDEGVVEAQFIVQDIVVYENGKYVLKNPISEEITDHIMKHLTTSEEEEFIKNQQDWGNVYL
ncbi:pilus assembly protein CpaF [Anaerosporobacter mobilis DSM 15930]|uniref:Pilus assembly protein CpaF n=1 Tax=Anaerosporobacter mobilis DSM 15930 TaxID=1120996 RepID=A0A1M7F4S5_9FIRM|nr:ATPase, T2SS/T4P/T4SS family [Anaerosporobacter mobilis]SHL98995.1 pilus assembly protein CpaF [Anaerosporobacter mobilis DSM 15930]